MPLRERTDLTIRDLIEEGAARVMRSRPSRLESSPTGSSAVRSSTSTMEPSGNTRQAEPEASGSRPQAKGTRRQRAYDEQHFRMRKWFLAADPWRQCCGSTRDLTLDHVIPRKRGGQSSLTNYRVLCRSFNSRRQDRDELIPPPKPRPRCSRKVLTGL
jgi:HNH endonuclease